MFEINGTPLNPDFDVGCDSIWIKESSNRKITNIMLLMFSMKHYGTLCV